MKDCICCKLPKPILGRGLCSYCWSHLYQMVLKGIISWRELELSGKCLPSRKGVIRIIGNSAMCSVCRKWLPLEHFHIDSRPDRLVSSRCKKCYRTAKAGKHHPGNQRRNLNRDKLRAQNAVRSAVVSGMINKPNECCQCSRQMRPHDIHAHHYAGYDKPMEIKWLCRHCHTLEHYPY